MAKDFKKAATSAVAALLPQQEQQEQQAQDRLETLQTQGNKDHLKLERINLAFSPSNIDYIRVMAGINGENMTKFINRIIAQHREANIERYKAALSLVEGQKFERAKKILDE